MKNQRKMFSNLFRLAIIAIVMAPSIAFAGDSDLADLKAQKKEKAAEIKDNKQQIKTAQKDLADLESGANDDLPTYTAAGECLESDNSGCTTKELIALHVNPKSTTACQDIYDKHPTFSGVSSDCRTAVRACGTVHKQIDIASDKKRIEQLKSDGKELEAELADINDQMGGSGDSHACEECARMHAAQAGGGVGINLPQFGFGVNAGANQGCFGAPTWNPYANSGAGLNFGVGLNTGGYNPYANMGYNPYANIGMNTGYSPYANSGAGLNFGVGLNTGGYNPYANMGYNPYANIGMNTGYNPYANTGAGLNFGVGLNTGGYNPYANRGYNPYANAGYNTGFNPYANAGYNTGFNPYANAGYNTGFNPYANAGYNTGYNGAQYQMQGVQSQAQQQDVMILQQQANQAQSRYQQSLQYGGGGYGQSYGYPGYAGGNYGGGYGGSLGGGFGISLVL